MDDKYIKKLEKKRLKQEKILLQRRQKLDKKIKKQEAQQKNSYDENDNGASSLNTETESLSPSINKLGTILGTILTFLIGYTIIDEIISVNKIEQVQTMFTDTAPILLLVSPLILITIYYLFKTYLFKPLT